MKVLSVSQIKELDAYAIAHEPISSLDLMERAATRCFAWILDHFGMLKSAFVLCGPGNNGGDGLVIARLLAEKGWKITVVYPDTDKYSPDFTTNLERLRDQDVSLIQLKEGGLPQVPADSLVIDALFGSGLTRPLASPYRDWVEQANTLPNLILSIDMPSGVFADNPTEEPAIRADFTLSFEVPKLAFLIPENQQYIGEWVILPIGLHSDALDALSTPWHVITEKSAARILKTRRKFDHKGVFGHALIFAGSTGKGGAAVLAARAALRSGAGLVTVHVPSAFQTVLHASVPEAMVDPDPDPHMFTTLPAPGRFTAIGGGCGIGMSGNTADGLLALCKASHSPLVLDADALNILAQRRDILDHVPPGSILTPHFKEFERLAGPCAHHFERLEKLREMAVHHKLVILLKGAHSAIATPEGTVFFNTTGNPGMASAGSGDVLTGLLTGLVAQGYDTAQAAILGAYLHGLAGDLAAEETGEEALIAGDIISCFGKAFQHLHTHQ